MKNLDTNKLREFIIQVSNRPGNVDWTNQDDLFLAGVLDSYSIIQLIVLIEESCQIVFNFNDLNFDDIKSVDSLKELLKKNYAI